MEIKTRVWDNTDKKMLFFDGIFNKRPYTEKSLMPQYESYPEYHDLEYMLYTGLKDKNGKPIFEDDIFKAPHDFGPNGYIERRGVVNFHKTKGYQWNYWLLDELEIIGNIHQDKHLLTKQTD